MVLEDTGIVMEKDSRYRLGHIRQRDPIHFRHSCPQKAAILCDGLFTINH